MEKDFWTILSAILYAANWIIVIWSCFSLIGKKQDPSKTISWVMIMILLPYIGLLLYVLFGRNFRKEYQYNKKGNGDLLYKKKLADKYISLFSNKDILPKDIAEFHKLIILNLKSNLSIPSIDKSIDIYFSGHDAIDAMCEEMEKAKEYIHLQSYIIEEDNVGNRIKDILIRKSQEGIEIRLIYDGFGAHGLSKKYLSELSNAGVELIPFSPLRPFLLRANYRNHRKILIIDGKTGFLGGVNLSNNYYTEWRDTHIKIVGQSVDSLQSSFLLDRYFVLNKHIARRHNYFPNFHFSPHQNTKLDTNSILSQIVTSGPDSQWASIMQCYTSAILQAKDHIYINTPYFVISSTMLNAIKITALSGVKVYLMIPEKSDTFISGWATRSYVKELLIAGVNIYFFKRRFNHSKVLSFDNKFCIIGSANIDNRSMEQNFEITSILYNADCAKKVESQFEKDLLSCSHITLDSWHKRPKRARIYESIGRLVSPLM